MPFSPFYTMHVFGPDIMWLSGVQDKKVNWQNVSFETRLERALNEDNVAEC